MRTNLRKCATWLIMLLMITIVIAFRPYHVHAAKAKKVKIKQQTLTTNYKIADRKAVKVKKGKTTLTNKAAVGYIKFTAPKTKKYKFKFSKLHIQKASKKKDLNTGSIMIQYREKNSNDLRYENNRNGMIYMLFMVTEQGYKKLKKMEKYKDFKKSQTVSIDLKKGETRYFYISAVVPNWSIKLSIQ